MPTQRMAASRRGIIKVTSDALTRMTGPRMRPFPSPKVWALLSCFVYFLRRLQVPGAGGSLQEQLLTWAQAAEGTPRPPMQLNLVHGNLFPEASPCTRPALQRRQVRRFPRRLKPVLGSSLCPPHRNPHLRTSVRESRACCSVMRTILPAVTVGLITYEKTTERPRGRDRHLQTPRQRPQMMTQNRP